MIINFIVIIKKLKEDKIIKSYFCVFRCLHDFDK